jgi:hypothetical protein
MYPPAGGLDRAAPQERGRARVRFPPMETEITIRDADIERLLAEPDRDEPFLVVPRRPDDAIKARDEIDEQILAGLVKP